MTTQSQGETCLRPVSYAMWRALWRTSIAVSHNTQPWWLVFFSICLTNVRTLREGRPPYMKWSNEPLNRLSFFLVEVFKERTITAKCSIRVYVVRPSDFFWLVYQTAPTTFWPVKYTIQYNQTPNRFLTNLSHFIWNYKELRKYGSKMGLDLSEIGPRLRLS